MIQPIFKDRDTQSRFERDGYVVIDFISPEEAKTVADKFYELHESIPKGFYSASSNPDDLFRQNIFDHTNKFLQKAVQENFRDYKILGGTFLCKSPGAEGMVAAHQDWSVVDETKFQSATIWVPTVDTTEENGAMRVLPGSHHFFDYHRSPNIEFCYKGMDQFLWDNMLTIPVKTGQAFILNHAVIHASSINKSDKERLVIVYAVTSKEAELRFYHKEKGSDNNLVEMFNVPDDFFQLYFNVGERPHFGQSQLKFSYEISPVTMEKLKQLIEKEKEERKLIPFFRDNWLRRSGGIKPVTGFLSKLLKLKSN